MRLTLRLLGLTVLDIEASTDDEPEAEEYDGSGTTSASPVSFLPSYGDGRWMSAGADYGAGEPEDR